MIARKDFRSVVKKSEQRTRLKLTKKLLEVERSNPEEFWKTISQMKK